MEETRHRFHEAVTELEQKTLDGFELVIEQLDRALQSVGSRDLELAETVFVAIGLFREIQSESQLA